MIPLLRGRDGRDGAAGVPGTPGTDGNNGRDGMLFACVPIKIKIQFK